MKMPDNRLPKQAYMREKLEDTKQHNWALNIKKCLDQYGFSEIWTNEGVNNENSFLKALRQRIIDNFKQDWHDKISNSDRFQTYYSFKEWHCEEEYLLGITIGKFRKAFTRIRLGVNELCTNRRYIDRTADTKCPFCKVEETELHFLIKCPRYDRLRTKYIN